jgi:hypothetical protein
MQIEQSRNPVRNAGVSFNPLCILPKSPQNERFILLTSSTTPQTEVDFPRVSLLYLVEDQGSDEVHSFEKKGEET